MALDFGKLTMAPCIAIFGARVLYERPRQPMFHVPGIYDRVALEIPFDDGPPQSSHKVTLGVRMADFPPGFAPAQHDRIQVALLGDQILDIAQPLPLGARQQAFDVMDVQHDGGGGAVLVLNAYVPDTMP